MAADNAKAAADQQAIRRGTQDYANRAHSSVAANRAAALDHSSQQLALYMGDRPSTATLATGQRVQMSNQYNQAWASTTGNSNEYILRIFLVGRGSDRPISLCGELNGNPQRCDALRPCFPDASCRVPP